MGDCSNRNHTVNSGCNNLHTGYVKQSPYKTESAIDVARHLFSSAGFITIYESRECKFDFSTNRKYLRKTLYSSIPGGVEKKGEEIYRFVEDPIEREIIKNAGGKWIPYRYGKKGNVTVYEHVDKNDFITGWYKTIESGKNQFGKSINWVRYFRNVGDKK